MRLRPWSIVLAATLLGCPGPGQPGKPPVGPRATATPKPPATAQSDEKPPALPTAKPGEALVPIGELRIVPAAALIAKTKLVGSVRLISDKGAGLISDNGAVLISNNGGGVMTAGNSGTVISQNGGNLVGNNGSAFRLLQGAPKEALLTDATVEVLDAAGRRLAGPDGQAITAATDAQGRFTLDAGLPAENLVLRVRLRPDLAGEGGELRAMLARGAGGERAIDVDTAASLGASYVLDRLVQGRQALYDRLGEADLAQLRTSVAGALAQLPAAPAYAPAALAAAAEAIRKGDPAVDGALKRIEAILVAGQQDLGDGRPATEVALGAPIAATLNAAGELVIAESYGRRLRVVGDDERIRSWIGARVKGKDARKVELGFLSDMLLPADGSVIVCEPLVAKVRRIAPDGSVSVVAGEGGPGPAIQRPAIAALAPDGTLYVGEWPGFPLSDGAAGRIIAYKPGAAAGEVVPLPEAGWAGQRISGLAVGPDGTLFASAHPGRFVARKQPGAAWELAELPLHGGPKRVTALADGNVLISELYGRRVLKHVWGGETVVVAGIGDRGAPNDGGPATLAGFLSCAGTSVTPDGRILIADAEAGTVRVVAPNGIISTAAGASGGRTEGDAFDVAINAPLAAAVDPRGRLVIAEIAGHTLKRVEAGQLTAIAGGGAVLEDPDPRRVAFDHPAGVAFDGEVMYVADSVTGVVRRIKADGTADVIMGRTGLSGLMNPVSVTSGRATEIALSRPVGLAVAADHSVYVSDCFANAVWKVAPDGTATLVAGALADAAGKPSAGLAPEGAVAVGAPLSNPTGLAIGPGGDLFIAEAGNYRVRRLGADGKLTTYAGSGIEQALGRLGGGEGELVRTGDKATEAFLAGPAGICFDAQGSLYVTVFGTTNLQLLGDFLPLATDVPIKVPPSLVKVAADGLVTVIAGPGGKLKADPEAEDALVLPFGVLLDPAGRLVVVDAGQNRVEAIPLDAR